MSQFKKYFKIIQESEESLLKPINFNGDFYTLTTKEKIEIKNYNLEIDEQQKPKGLWFTKGDQWIQFLIENGVIDEDGKSTPHLSLFQGYEVKNIAKIKIQNAKIIVIDEQKKLDFFIQNYGQKDGEKEPDNSTFLFDWKKLSEDYRCDGIYIDTNLLSRRYYFISIWDVPSGCIWNLSGKIKEEAIIPIKNYKKFF